MNDTFAETLQVLNVASTSTST